MIPAGETSISFNVTITDDILFENAEKFSLTINQNSSPHIITVNPKKTTVIIMDDDGKHIYYYLEYDVTLFYVWHNSFLKLFR